LEGLIVEFRISKATSSIFAAERPTLSFKERAGVRMGLSSGFSIPIPTLILPLKGRKPAF
jgi:hypothetical protein